ncbi:CDP-alcohol phosphatidyltransferase family protein [Halobacterium salinarum]|uniref:CDP-diacylglycerol-glycerol-3-phosphate 3-phosphatidyltransferase n=3 Tax=Halobacterium salinarum TaxID=2242 RepID=Q9HQS2_HALSA|nr:CDP-alcohol phosphatidyltransferase family protein [Halobacterium salinarum]AAG19441.1 CDP-diacylglycerol-glycerol-3-phosphate 3-phosphatidyltransferase [Halobacterium salinarum NRC-1]MBB6090125.1 archaetidylinositol phosphate synthase [Halobacterium salinarum]MCF2165543.1 CDP-alcohol phosphatidyltransferase family protein [Halobacterium salinarum]MCF2168712.1 CDP-alcohol phosphatidyltransferase family protein [Halobacterium salinarum]MCF2238132.1 CDP-alcohol phosphatidyltransferase family 
MTLDQFRPLANRLLDPWVRAAKTVGATPNTVSVAAFGLAVVAAAAFYVGTPAAYAVGAVCVFFNGWLDLLDGALAREVGTASEAGDLLDHVLDRYADVVVVTGAAAGVDAFGLGLAAVTGVLLTSYLGTQAQAVGLDRVYGGLLGRADRLALVGVTAGVAAITPTVAGYSPVVALLVVFAVVGHLTAIQRFVSAWRQLA